MQIAADVPDILLAQPCVHFPQSPPDGVSSRGTADFLGEPCRLRVRVEAPRHLLQGIHVQPIGQGVLPCPIGSVFLCPDHGSGHNGAGGEARQHVVSHILPPQCLVGVQGHTVHPGLNDGLYPFLHGLAQAVRAHPGQVAQDGVVRLLQQCVGHCLRADTGHALDAAEEQLRADFRGGICHGVGLGVFGGVALVNGLGVGVSGDSRPHDPQASRLGQAGAQLPHQAQAGQQCIQGKGGRHRRHHVADAHGALSEKFLPGAPSFLVLEHLPYLRAVFPVVLQEHTGRNGGCAGRGVFLLPGQKIQGLSDSLHGAFQAGSGVECQLHQPVLVCDVPVPVFRDSGVQGLLHGVQIFLSLLRAVPAVVTCPVVVGVLFLLAQPVVASLAVDGCPPGIVLLLPPGTLLLCLVDDPAYNVIAPVLAAFPESRVVVFRGSVAYPAQSLRLLSPPGLGDLRFQLSNSGVVPLLFLPGFLSGGGVCPVLGGCVHLFIPLPLQPSDFRLGHGLVQVPESFHPGIGRHALDEGLLFLVLGLGGRCLQPLLVHALILLIPQAGSDRRLIGLLRVELAHVLPALLNAPGHLLQIGIYVRVVQPQGLCLRADAFVIPFRFQQLLIPLSAVVLIPAVAVILLILLHSGVGGVYPAQPVADIVRRRFSSGYVRASLADPFLCALVSSGFSAPGLLPGGSLCLVPGQLIFVFLRPLGRAFIFVCHTQYLLFAFAAALIAACFALLASALVVLPPS